ncbi:Fur family transcriptional regulator [Poritiphilus flavus]|uniref:Transcriptional repressor n=1 Tax=Poritiphilus flavus TaxID=2697053 RepID=A0A6L9EGS4_9FLAO|nr:transcriptional repressor [Poritiphilus flavus]NAS13967.1 transcriptional repressor [Poritiphilus flavus]
MQRRKTPTKEAVLKILKDSGRAMSQEGIESEINIEINRATIYRILNRFCEDGLVHKIVAEDGKQYFALCLNCSEKKHRDNHFHFRCLSCQSIECLEEPVNFSVPAGYQVTSLNCVISGVCKDCYQHTRLS